MVKAVCEGFVVLRVRQALRALLAISIPPQVTWINLKSAPGTGCVCVAVGLLRGCVVVWAHFLFDGVQRVVLGVVQWSTCDMLDSMSIPTSTGNNWTPVEYKRSCIVAK